MNCPNINSKYFYHILDNFLYMDYNLSLQNNIRLYKLNILKNYISSNYQNRLYIYIKRDNNYLNKQSIIFQHCNKCILFHNLNNFLKNNLINNLNLSIFNKCFNYQNRMYLNKLDIFLMYMIYNYSISNHKKYNLVHHNKKSLYKPGNHQLNYKFRNYLSRVCNPDCPYKCLKDIMNTHHYYIKCNLYYMVYKCPNHNKPNYFDCTLNIHLLNCIVHNFLNCIVHNFLNKAHIKNHYF